MLIIARVEDIPVPGKYSVIPVNLIYHLRFKRFVRKRKVRGVFKAKSINNHFSYGIVSWPFQMKKPVMIAYKIVDADGHGHSVGRFYHHSTTLGGGWKTQYFGVMQAPKNAQRLLVVSNHVFCNAAHHVGKSSVIQISPGTDFCRSGTPAGRTYDI